jgi:DNA-binding GntR family transcriptional regulator
MSVDLRSTMRTKLAQAIREAILNRELLPGQKLPEAEMCAKYRVSHTPLREAFLMLEQEGLVRISSHVGVFVSSFSKTEVIDLLKVEAVMEGLAVAKAAQHISEQQVAELQELHQHAIAVPTSAPDLDAFYRYDRSFHSLLVAFSASPILIGILAKQLSQIYLCRFYTTIAPDRLQHSLKEHGQILQHLMDHDGQASQNALQVHLESVIRDFIHMSEHDEHCNEALGSTR